MNFKPNDVFAASAPNLSIIETLDASGSDPINPPSAPLSDHRATLLETPVRAECLELRLVLESAGIPAWVDASHGRWRLSIDSDHVARAQQEIHDYQVENSTRTNEIRAVTPVYHGAVLGVFGYAVWMLLIGIATLPWALGIDLFTPGEMQAGRVTAGEWWRVVTALTLHVNEGHLASNLLFGVLFGFLAGRALGGGVAWLSILIAGSMGNLINAWIQRPQHTSVGASTAVFSALGLLVAIALRPRASSQQSLLRRWRPLVGGVMLLAMIGVGDERTDVTAHVTGFLSGLLIGAIISRTPSRWLASDRVQWSAAAATIVLLAAAWVIALQSTFQ